MAEENVNKKHGERKILKEVIENLIEKMQKLL